MCAMLTKEQFDRKCGYGTCFQYVPSRIPCKSYPRKFCIYDRPVVAGIPDLCHNRRGSPSRIDNEQLYPRFIEHHWQENHRRRDQDGA